MPAIIHVCTTCRAGQPLPDDGTCPGQRLHDALCAGDLPAGVSVRAVECLSACTQGAALALAKPGGWTYVYGRLVPGDAPEILRGAALYAASPDGIVPWRDRPMIFRKQSLARIPPMES